MIEIYIAASLLAVVMMWRAARGQSDPVKGLDDLQGRTLEVDLGAFRNLIDPTQDEFLRRELGPREFRATQRARRLAAIDYLRRAAHNATILLRLGEAARKSAEPAIVAAGEQLVGAALIMRLYSLLAIAELYVEVALPDVSFSLAKAIEHYEILRASLSRLGYLQRPAAAHLYTGI